MPPLPAPPSGLAHVRDSGPWRQPPGVARGSWAGALWTVVIALDFFWLSNPLVFFTFEASLRNACAVTLLATVVTPRRRSVLPPWGVVAVLGYGFLTAIWSTHSTLTVQFTLIYVALAVVGLAVAAAVDTRTIAQGVLLGGVVYVLASIYAFWVELPGAVVLHSPTQTFPAGVGTNRNIMSYALVLVVALAIGVVPRTWRGRGVWAAGMGTVFVGLYLTLSATGLVTAVLLCGAAVAMGWGDRAVGRRARPAPRVRWWVVLLPIATLVAAVAVLRAVLQESGRDGTTLSGRTPLWSATWDALEGWDLFVGAGWGAVWQHPWLAAGANAIHADIVARNDGTWQPHGHNWFFDLLPELGLVGSLLFATVYVQAIWRGIGLRRSPAVPTQEGLEASRVVLLGVLALLIYGITEPMSTIPLGWFVLVMLATEPSVRGRRIAEPAVPTSDAEDRTAC